MGLDMYAFQVIKPSLDPEKVYIRRKLLGEYVVLPPDKAASDRYLQVAPYAQKLRVISRYFNMEKIRQDFHMPDAEIGTVSSEGIRIVGKVDGVATKREISMKQIEALYTVEREEDCLVFTKEQVAYWRNEQDLQVLISESLDADIQNTGFYLLDEKTVDIINQYNSEHDSTMFIRWREPTATSALFYYEWY